MITATYWRRRNGGVYCDIKGCPNKMKAYCVAVEGPRIVTPRNITALAMCSKHLKIVKVMLKEDIITRHNSKMVAGFKWDEVPIGMKMMKPLKH